MKQKKKNEWHFKIIMAGIIKKYIGLSLAKIE